jgi:hypothetical protein
MKRSRTSALALTAIFILVFGVSPGAGHAVQRELRIAEYEGFLDVLEPLEREALPQKDFRRIREMAGELVIRGKEIVALGIPDGYGPVRRFAMARKAFDRSLDRFKLDAKSGSNLRLKKAFVAVHDSFAELEDSLPAGYPISDPPGLMIEGPATKVQAGSIITLTAHAPDAEFSYLWKASAGKIVSGQNTRTITLDTSGLAGQTIYVSVKIEDGNGLGAAASCAVEISTDK